MLVYRKKSNCGVATHTTVPLHPAWGAAQRALHSVLEIRTPTLGNQESSCRRIWVFGSSQEHPWTLGPHSQRALDAGGEPDFPLPQRPSAMPLGGRSALGLPWSHFSLLLGIHLKLGMLSPSTHPTSAVQNHCSRLSPCVRRDTNGNKYHATSACSGVTAQKQAVPEAADVQTQVQNQCPAGNTSSLGAGDSLQWRLSRRGSPGPAPGLSAHLGRAVLSNNVQ